MFSFSRSAHRSFMKFFRMIYVNYANYHFQYLSRSDNSGTPHLLLLADMYFRWEYLASTLATQRPQLLLFAP